MTLAIAWSHDPGDPRGGWSHEGGDSHVLARSHVGLDVVPGRLYDPCSWLRWTCHSDLRP